MIAPSPLKCLPGQTVVQSPLGPRCDGVPTCNPLPSEVSSQLASLWPQCESWMRGVPSHCPSFGAAVAVTRQVRS